MNSDFKRAVLVILINLLAACADDDGRDTISSREVDTENTYVDMHITSNGADQVRVDVQLLNGGPTEEQIVLRAEDQLWVSTGPIFLGQSITENLFSGLEQMSEDNHKLELNTTSRREFNFFLFLRFLIYGDVVYGGNLGHPQEGLQYYIAYLRHNRTTADNSYVTLPQDFLIGSPMENERPSRSNDLMITWEPYGSNHSLDVYVTHSCLNDSYDEISELALQDSGVYLLTADRFGATVSGQCSTTLEVTKHELGRIDQNLGGGGKIVGHQSRSVNFVTID